MKKRVLSMLLAFILCFSTLPMTAFAQEADAVAEQEEQQEKRNEYVRNIYNAYQKKDIQTIESALSRYYLLLAEYVREERSKTA